MAVLKLSRFEVRADACEAAERALHDHAANVRKDHPDIMWTAYRDGASPGQYAAFLRAETPAAEARYVASSAARSFAVAITPLLVGTVEVVDYQLVTSTDLARRRR